MDKLLGSLADKAQSAIDASPLAGHVPSIGHQNRSPRQSQAQINTSSTYSRTDTTSSSSGPALGGPWLENIQHSIRSLQVQYTPQPSSEVRQLQLVIHGQKGVSLDFDSVSRDTKSHAKELYLWGQDQTEDIKDVTDRLAYFNFAHGALASSLATTLDQSRAPLKALRDAEVALTPRRTARANLAVQIHRLRTEGSKSGGTNKKIAEVEAQLKKLRADDEGVENEVEKLRRQVLRDSEGMKWSAIKEYAEKLILLSQASETLLLNLPTEAPTPAKPYTGVKRTATVRASLQKALDNYKPGQRLPTVTDDPTADDEADERSFGETHKSELDRIPSGLPRPSGTPPPTAPSTSSAPIQPSSPSSPPIPLDPSVLNHAPAPIPVPVPSSSPSASFSIASVATPDGPPSSTLISSTDSPVPVAPTIAETGVPVSGGDRGPGPSSGSLSRDSDGTTPTIGRYGESAEYEKKRLEREERERILHVGVTTGASGSGESSHENAEEEKRRLEREERERILRGDTQQHEDSPVDGPPPYTD